jgi:tRNA(Ile)-lysidine synthase
LTWIARPGGIDAGRLPAALIVRRRDGGETLRPAPQAKTQTVQHLCQSLGVLPWMRDSLPLVFAGHELIAVADLWLDAGWCAAAGAPGLGLAWNNAPLVT